MTEMATKDGKMGEDWGGLPRLWEWRAERGTGEILTNGESDIRE